MEINNNHPDPIILGSLCSRHENGSDVVVATDFMSCDNALAMKFPFDYMVCGISNGLLCISSWNQDKEVYIWNPLTNDHITISCLPTPSIRPGYQTCTWFGFGFVRDVNVYKVVRLFDQTNFDEDVVELHNPGTQISVYSIGVDSMWRNVEVDIPHYLALRMEISPLVNGALHWQTQRPGTISLDLVVTFDLKEVIGEFLLPDGIQFDEIVELSGFLCAINRRRVDEEETHIWVMKEYGVVSSWSKQYIIGKPEGHINFYYLSPLGVTHNGGIILRNAGEGLVLYNPETKTVKELKRFQFAPRFLVYAFLGSIISPKAISQAGHTFLEEES